MVKENKANMFGDYTYSLKSTILVALCLQNAGYTLLRKYSTKYEQISSKEILLVAELLKIIFSGYYAMQQSYNPEDFKSDAQGTGFGRISWLIFNSKTMLILAFIYGLMNILSFISLEYIGAGEFTICAQLKILTTASFSVLILGTSLTNAKWRALLLLVLGCILVASPTFTSNSSNSQNEPSSASDLILGYGAVLTEVVLSGFASIYFEKVVKSTKEVITIWERNVQLGFYSIIMYGGILMYENMTSQAEEGASTWGKWTTITWLVAILGAAGGLLVAATLKYADSILKTLAAAGAIVLSTVLGHYFLDGPLDAIVSIGAMVTILSIANYTFDNSTS
jgi:UDP-sugar transporter A1/2/3